MFGDPEAVAHLPGEFVNKVQTWIGMRVEETIDRMKTSAEAIPVVLVGGGSVVLPSAFAGASVVHRPEHFEVANAIGAAIAQCSGEVERIFSLDDHTREEALEIARNMARDEAIKAGADPGTVEIIDIQEVPLAYLPGNATRIRVRAAGDLILSSSQTREVR
jgi:N-methylhydantoinase A/oxoprolinase/acetone carboxylase beta subunit